MLPLEKQVTSLGTSRKLKELGVKQESLFYWWKQCSAVHQGHSKDSVNYIYLIQPYFDGLNIDEDFHYSALTCSELGELLPKDYISKYSDDYKWMVYWWDWAVYKRYVEGQNTEVEARAKMLIYLLENKIITLEKTDEKISK